MATSSSYLRNDGQELEMENAGSEKSGCLSKRYTLAWLIFLGFFAIHGIRSNFSVATEAGAYEWSLDTEALIEASFYLGFVLTQIPGGILAARYSSTRVFGSAIAVTTCLNLLLPGAIKLNWVCALLIRLIQGLSEGVIYPASHGIWRHWAPPMERTRLVTLAFAGGYAGALVGLPVSRMFILSLGWSWQVPFYFNGILGLVWYALWRWSSFEKPAKHPTISRKECAYIESSIGAVSPRPPTFGTTPWSAIFRSMPVYAILVANFCRSWTYYLLLISLPAYFKDIFLFDVNKSGLLGVLPYLSMAITLPLGGILSDLLQSKGQVTTTNVRKAFLCVGFGLQALFLIIMSSTVSTHLAIFASILAVASSGFAVAGFQVNHLDIAPRYASTLMGISNFVGNLAGFICPLTLIPMKKTDVGWQYMYIFSAVIQIGGIIFYAIFASGEQQEWAEPREKNKQEETA